MDTSKKYRRFGIGALIVLGVVVLIAIIVIVNTINKTPKALTEETPITTTSEEKKEEKTETKKEEIKQETKQETKKETKQEVVRQNPTNTATNTESMPSTGPEDMVLPIILVAVSAYLIALNVNWTKRGLKDEEEA